MLSPEEKMEIDEELRHVPVRQSVCLEALKIVQRHRGGWVNDEALADVAEYVGLSPAALDNVATFYNLIYRKPVGRHVILLCDSVSCWLTGYDEVREHLFRRLGIRFGQTSPDNRFTLLPIACLGICDRAPAMLIGADTHVELTLEKIDRILGEYQ